MEECNVTSLGRRRVFWTTQPAACGMETSCGVNCGTPGLQLIDPANLACPSSCTNMDTCDEPTPLRLTPRTFANTNYARGLALNILLTDARKADTECGHKPGGRGGHWADSYREDGATAGTSLRQIGEISSIAEGTALIKAAAQDSLQKLVLYGVAVSVEVLVNYVGGNTWELLGIIHGQDAIITKVGITGSRISNAWVWNSGIRDIAT